MNRAASHAIERHCDVCVIGGSFAGLSAALQLARRRRSVIVVDAGRPRNDGATHVHGVFGQEGARPSDLAAAGREQVRGYGCEVVAATAERVTRAGDADLRIELTGGHTILARRALAATGLVDELPAIEGIADHWGRDVSHDRFCPGYEFRDRRIVLIATHPSSVRRAIECHRLTARLTVVLHDAGGIDGSDLAALLAAGVDVHEQRATRIAAGAGGRVAAVELADGARVGADLVAVSPRFRVRAEPFAPLGLRPAAHPGGLGDRLETDAIGRTAIAGLFAAGNVVDPEQDAVQAAADGARAGAAICADLAADDLRSGPRRSTNQIDWDRRYEDGQMWSGNPNGTLVNEASGLAPGRALDVGAGEGGDAIWLAKRGWRVTASDISQRALDRVATEAARRGLEIECLRADANDLDPFEAAAFDLVSAQYAAIPRTPDRRAERNLLEAVARGGTLLIVSHDLEPMREHAHHRPFDADAYVRIEDVAAVLAATPGWSVEVNQTRPRPPGAASSSHHVNDVVLRARRLS